ncbi:hypothetical protein RBH29_17290, partial [Herbivorax sp. ANBcel31]|uniref:HD domain-containing protein n=1 Tax=Herbivorax sp. ANBcel31 TaxID=3069754 RepID=UPI0027B73BA0
MAKLRDFLDDDYREYLQNKVIPFCHELWGKDERYPHYNIHGLEHSERIEARLDKLFTDRYWSQEEAMILLLAIYLHDIGMNSDKIEEFISKGERPQYFNEETLEKIRCYHGELSFDLINALLDKNRILNNQLSLEIPDKYRDFFENAAKLARYHCENEYTFKNAFENQRVSTDLKLLLYMLRIGDSLDCDYNRVNEDWFKRNVHLMNNAINENWSKTNVDSQETVKDKYHPLSHHYVEEIEIQNSNIKIHFRIPPGNSDFCNGLIKCVRQNISKNINEAKECLKNHNIAIPEIKTECECFNNVVESFDWDDKIFEYVNNKASKISDNYG